MLEFTKERKIKIFMGFPRKFDLLLHLTTDPEFETQNLHQPHENPDDSTQSLYFATTLIQPSLPQSDCKFCPTSMNKTLGFHTLSSLFHNILLCLLLFLFHHASNYGLFLDMKAHTFQSPKTISFLISKWVTENPLLKKKNKQSISVSENFQVKVGRFCKTKIKSHKPEMGTSESTRNLPESRTETGLESSELHCGSTHSTT